MQNMNWEPAWNGSWQSRSGRLLSRRPSVVLGHPDIKLKQTVEAGWNVTETCQGIGGSRSSGSVEQRLVAG